mmetsp:Transcript_37050/g.35772  ORF Transcript_37050/g.35772 Transcript_37050/m.35772 type:complete len:279 (+) Transcript_37050:105-941(+)
MGHQPFHLGLHYDVGEHLEHVVCSRRRVAGVRGEQSERAIDELEAVEDAVGFAFGGEGELYLLEFFDGDVPHGLVHMLGGDPERFGLQPLQAVQLVVGLILLLRLNFVGPDVLVELEDDVVVDLAEVVVDVMAEEFIFLEQQLQPIIEGMKHLPHPRPLNIIITKHLRQDHGHLPHLLHELCDVFDLVPELFGLGRRRDVGVLHRARAGRPLAFQSQLIQLVLLLLGHNFCHHRHLLLSNRCSFLRWSLISCWELRSSLRSRSLASSRILHHQIIEVA